MTNRNPYLVLGLEFGASHAEARRRFALAARRVKRDPTMSITVEDLTWALNEIESLESSPEHLVDVYRVPANPLVFVPPGHGLFRPAPAALERRTEPDEHALDRLRAAAGVELLGELLRAFSAGVDIDCAYRAPDEGNQG